MSEEQRILHDRVVAGPRGEMIGPLLAAIHNVELAVPWAELGEVLRFRTSLPKHLNELAIIVCGRHWVSQVEWWVHARVALEAGLDAPVVAAIKALESPVFDNRASLEVYEFVRLLLTDGQVPASLHGAVLERWGVTGVVELAALVGYYSMVAMTLNAHQIPVPDDHHPLPETGTLAALAPGTLGMDGTGDKGGGHDCQGPRVRSIPRLNPEKNA